MFTFSSAALGAGLARVVVSVDRTTTGAIARFLFLAPEILLVREFVGLLLQAVVDVVLIVGVDLASAGQRLLAIPRGFPNPARLGFEPQFLIG
jgi:hypothetical protein